MSIKTMAMIPEDELKHIEDRRTALVVPVCDEWSDRDCVMLYAIPDTHRIMPLKLTEKMIAAAIPELMREGDEDKYRAIGQLICVWDALIDAAKEEQRNDN